MCQVDEEYSESLQETPSPTPPQTVNARSGRRSLRGPSATSSAACPGVVGRAYRVSKKCMKCKEGAAVLIIRVGDAFCRNCFKEYFIHKFRAMLGKNRVIFPGEKVLLAVSGGPASCSMLAQVQEGLSREAPKKLRFVPGVIYIDEGGACAQTAEQRQKTVAELENMFRKTGFPFHIVALEQVFTLPGSVLESGSCTSDGSNLDYKEAVNKHLRQSVTKLRPEEGVMEEMDKELSRLGVQEFQYNPENTLGLERLFSSLTSLTAKEDLLQTLRQHLILHTARTNGYSKVMMGDSCTRLAIRLLTNISLGRGAALAADTGFSDPRYGDVVVVRPMRDYSSKEIVFYNRLFGVEDVFIPGLDTEASEKASIQRLTESFVIRLQADFPSTVSTIYRTSEKLHTSRPHAQSCSAENSNKCLLCLSAMDTNADGASAFQATLVSERLSRGDVASSPPVLPTASCHSSGVSCGAGGCCSTVREAASPPDLKNFLCYSCRLTVKDMTEVDLLPHYVTSQAEKRQRRAQMKEEISEFLLENSDDEE